MPEDPIVRWENEGGAVRLGAQRAEEGEVEATRLGQRVPPPERSVSAGNQHEAPGKPA